MKKRPFIIILLSNIMIILMVVSLPLSAQECVAQAQEIIANMSDSCASSGSGTACFGNSATIDGEGTFANVGDTIPLGSFSTITTGDGSFGAAVLHVPANVPSALSPNGLNFILLGNTTVTNNVTVDGAFTPSETVTVTAIVGANLRSTPSTDGRVIGGAVAGTSYPAYGMSRDGQWLLILNEGVAAWISRQVVAPAEGDINSLAIITGNERSLMQDFSLSTASTNDCAGAPPSILMIEGPAGFSSLIVVNGIEIRLTGAIALWINSNGQLQMAVLSGGATSGNLNLPAGFTMVAPLDENGVGNSGWTGLRPMNEGERNVLLTLEGIPANLLLTALVLPTQEQINQTLSSLNNAGLGQTSAGPASGQANCRTFRPTSPLQGMPNNGSTPFYWDGASGATGYRFNVYNESGNVVTSVDLSAISTTFVANTTPDGIGGGSIFRWEVQALVNGQVACTTAQVTLIREAGQQSVSNNGGGGTGSQPQAQPTVCDWQGCK